MPTVYRVMASEFYLYLDSEQSKKLYPTNTSSNFTIQLPAPYHLTGEWECGLVQYNFDYRVKPGLYFCCDLLTESHAGEFMLPVLRRVHDSSWQFRTILYVPLKILDFGSITFYFRTWTNADVAPIKEPGYFTLHFRRLR